MVERRNFRPGVWAASPEQPVSWGHRKMRPWARTGRGSLGNGVLASNRRREQYADVKGPARRFPFAGIVRIRWMEVVGSSSNSPASDHVLVDVKAKPSGWPTASLDPDSGRGPRAASGMPAPRDPQNQVSTVSGDCHPGLGISPPHARCAGSGRVHAACSCWSRSPACRASSKVIGERIPREEWRRSWLYSSIHAATRRRAWALVVKCSS